MQALKIAATGMSAQQMRVDVTANNISNMSTTGYNARRADFADLHYQQLRSPGAIVAGTGEVLPAGVQIGLGVRPAAVAMEIKQGSMRPTGGELDIAIQGNGYFEIEMPDGTSAYTRDGAFKLTGDGQIVTSEGYPLMPDITVPEEAREVVINADGTVFARFADQVQGQQIGTITLAGFINEKGLEAIGDNLFVETEASGNPVIGEPGLNGRGTLRQGFLEESSVDVVAEITELIEAQRGYELNARVMTAADEMLSATTRIR
ncbi:flagellar basal-body rod protein FlgG [Limibaculum sp. M0105]|uniref:Flagellar basal-body rod protein FlgG n=1 Tax=Thermohalobaculum xanthum TaxID=2753746 RepID=A0A8J7SAX5_9RHOB|nr:flagellar basal-body rod protein FlgG [Thermohalobaculum xanthum]MBK0398128.1 flagellar basal-body rod protein FlgG [Thermohalobaculum xanthum]